MVAAAKEQAFREQRHRHTASMSALREEQAALERAKRELESCLIAARNQAALLQASQREESGEGAQCWEQVRMGVGRPLGAGGCSPSSCTKAEGIFAPPSHPGWPFVLPPCLFGPCMAPALQH